MCWPQYALPQVLKEDIRRYKSRARDAEHAAAQQEQQLASLNEQVSSADLPSRSNTPRRCQAHKDGVAPAASVETDKRPLPASDQRATHAQLGCQGLVVHFSHVVP
eukprot:GHUV01034258.1.p1 GENE.GHUV01034258.1~~GHUV01034258.1.p1  ORF type:complete len:106 (+),score=27.07 GHUV01034258.1:1123-1440(+)